METAVSRFGRVELTSLLTVEFMSVHQKKRHPKKRREGLRQGEVWRLGFVWGLLGVWGLGFGV